MTLKEKFEIATDGWIVSDKCVKISEDFAIVFAEWYLNLWLTDDDLSFDDNSPQELLEIYKKENGL
jgi:hypothetical protein